MMIFVESYKIVDESKEQDQCSSLQMNPVKVNILFVSRVGLQFTEPNP